MSVRTAPPRPAAASDTAADALCAPWTLFRRRREQAAVRLLCLPFAGGTALAYRHWGERLPDFIEVCPLQLPGRSSRAHEPAFTSAAALLEDLLPAIEPLLDRPVALFGHSMGAALAFALAAALEQRSMPPLRLFASARRPPLPGSIGRLHRQTDSELADYLRELGGTPDIVFEDAELRALVFRLLRADLEMNDHYIALQPLRKVPICALGGTHDPYVAPEVLDGWSALTEAAFDSQLFPGGHFYTQQHEAQVTRYLAARLRTDLEGPQA